MMIVSHKFRAATVTFGGLLVGQGLDVEDQLVLDRVVRHLRPASQG